VLLVENGTLWKRQEQSAIYASSETLRQTLLVSNYAPSTLCGCRLAWAAALSTAFSNAAPFASGTITVRGCLAQGSVSALGVATIKLPAVGAPTQFNLSASLSCSGGLKAPRANDWQAWVYPVASAASPSSSTFEGASQPPEVLLSPSIFAALNRR